MSVNKPPKRAALGRGLSSLLGEAQSTYGNAEAPVRPLMRPDGRETRLDLDQLQPGQFQPRRHFDEAAAEELTQSIKAKGVLTPLLVRRISDHKYEIIAGERRWRAAQQAGVNDVPVVIKEMSDSDALEIGLIENLQRADLNPLEEAAAYQRLMDEFGHTQQALAETVGKSRSHVANLLRLLSLPEPVKELLMDGKLTAGHARALLTAPDPVKLARDIVARGLSVREAERLAANLPEKPPHERAGTKSGGTKNRSADIVAIERDLELRLGLKVEVETEGTGGRLILHFRSLDQFDTLLGTLMRG
jgi:ParB family chromosome partitioning protein